MSTKDASFAIYRNRDEIRIAVRSLLKLGFQNSDLMIFQAKHGGAQDFQQVQKYQIKKGAILGAPIGAIILGGIGFAAGGQLSGSPLGIMAAAAALGLVLGAVCGTLVGIGTPDPAAKRYGQYLKSGGILLSVHNQNLQQIQKAQKVLSATGGQDIQLINESDTWGKANLERVDLEKLEAEGRTDTLEHVLKGTDSPSISH